MLNSIIKTQRYVFKASWRSTAVKFYVEASDLAKAQNMAERFVRKMQGWPMCLDIVVIDDQTRPTH